MASSISGRFVGGLVGWLDLRPRVSYDLAKAQKFMALEIGKNRCDMEDGMWVCLQFHPCLRDWKICPCCIDGGQAVVEAKKIIKKEFKVMMEERTSFRLCSTTTFSPKLQLLPQRQAQVPP